MPTLQIPTQHAHVYHIFFQQKKRDRSGGEMAPQQWHQHPMKKLPSSLVLALESATRPKAKTEAQILARWRNRTPVYARHPLKEVEVWCLIRLATGTWLVEGRLCKNAQRMWQAKPAGRKFLPRRIRILPPAGSLEAWLHAWLSCAKRVSSLLSCGEGCFIGHEQGNGAKNPNAAR